MQEDSSIVPYFSVVIPTKGRSWIIKDTIQSVLQQSFSDFELLIIDNDDNDETMKVVSSFSDHRLVYIRTGGLSMSANWQIGINRSKGQFVILTADKTGIKQDGLLMLHCYTKLYNEINVFNYEYDTYYDEDNVYISRVFEVAPKLVSANELLSLLLDSKHAKFSHLSGRGYNSCIRREVLKRIRRKVGDVCVGFNPDYTIAYNLMMDGQNAIYIPFSPLLARMKSFKSDKHYGNGNAYTNKTSLFMSYLTDCTKSGLSYCDLVPIKAFVVYSVLLNDFFHVAAKWGKNYQFNKIEYYYFHYKETLYRKSFLVDVDDELMAIKKAISREQLSLRLKLNVIVAYLVLRSQLYGVYRFMERYILVRKFLSRLRSKGENIPDRKYSNFLECAISERCVLP